jgi:hypothetical protein
MQSQSALCKEELELLKKLTEIYRKRIESGPMRFKKSGKR